jgi:hypothetical protein
MNVGGLLQELPGSLVTVRTGDIETFDEGHTNPTVPIQTSKKLLVNGHRDHVGEALIRDWTSYERFCKGVKG